MRSDQRIQLSEAGQMRRDAMLGDLLLAMDTHHRRRHTIRRTVSVCGALLLIAGAAAYIITAAGANAPITAHSIVATNTQESIAPSPAPGMLIARIDTDPTVLDRYRMANASSAIILSDTDLLESLREINRPAGLVRMEGEVWLTASVVDDPAYHAIRPNSL
jgi:hypothetical protein